MIVTVPPRLAGARVSRAVRLARLEGVQLCPNYVVAETVLAQQRRDLFIAHSGAGHAVGGPGAVRRIA
jgi:hypothetical protein